VMRRNHRDADDPDPKVVPAMKLGRSIQEMENGLKNV